jgi:hypothetical protein
VEAFSFPTDLNFSFGGAMMFWTSRVRSLTKVNPENWKLCVSQHEYYIPIKNSQGQNHHMTTSIIYKTIPQYIIDKWAVPKCA